MPLQTHTENNSQLLWIHVSGKIDRSDLTGFELEFGRLICEHGKLRVLFDITDFHGWTAGALWEEVRFDVKHFADIERLAVIGANKWHHAMATLFKPFTKATIGYFDQTQLSDGRQWLEAA